MKRKLICLYSGGVKSVACLSEVLTNKLYEDYIVQVHYVHIINHTGQFKKDVDDVKKTLKYFQDTSERAFIISENQINFSCLPYPSLLPNDIDICVFVANQMLSTDKAVRYIAMGFSKEDFGIQAIFSRIQKSLDLTKINPDAALDAEYIFPLSNKTRVEIIAGLSSEKLIHN